MDLSELCILWTPIDNGLGQFCSLNDRKPISDDDDVIVLVVPDYQMLSEVQKIASVLAEDTESRVGI